MLGSVQYRMVATHSVKHSVEPICAPPHLSEVSSMLLLKQFQSWSDCRWPFLVLSIRKIAEQTSFLRLSPPGDWWCEVLGFVPLDNVSSSSTLQIFRDLGHLWWLLCPQAALLGHLPWFGLSKTVQPQKSAKVDACRTLTSASPGIRSLLGI